MFNNKKTKKRISTTNWPFNENDIVKLIWIDHPYRAESGDWMVDLYFRRLQDGRIEKTNESWGVLNLLSIGRLYKNGNLMTEQKLHESEYGEYSKGKIQRFDFTNQEFVCRTGKHVIETCDNKYEVYKNAFITKLNGYEIHIPVIEVLKSILIQNRKLVYAILEPNSLDYYYILEEDIHDKERITLHFTKAYPSDLLTKKHIRHLVWLKTNSKAIEAWNSVYMNIIKGKDGIKFPFPLDGEFSVIGRCKADTNRKNIIRIEEITWACGFKIPYKKANFESPNYNEVRNSNNSKKTKFNAIKDNDITLNPGKGSNKDEEIIEIPMTVHDYNDDLEITKNPSNTYIRKKGEDENTEKVNISIQNELSPSDIGGRNRIKGIEFKSKEEIEKDVAILGEDIEIYIEIINKLIEKYRNVSASFSVGDLPELENGKNFSRLDDGVKLRKYLLAQITLDKENIVYLIEVERYGKSLSTLLVNPCGYKLGDLQTSISEILKGLVEKNGTWHSDILERYEKCGFRFARIRHISINKDIFELAERLYDKISMICSNN